VEAAEKVLREASAESGGSFPAVYQLGRLLLWSSRYEEAADLLGRCAAQAQGAADVQLDLARALDGAGRTEQALEAFRRAVELAPEHSEMRYGLAMALMRTGDREAAKAELETYGSLYQREQRQTMQAGLERARVARGRELVRQGRAEEAVAHLSDLPESADSLSALAAALRAQGDLQGAAERLARAVALEPDRTDLRTLLNETRLELLRRR
jgi:Flp pilus assembly protein TadD